MCSLSDTTAYNFLGMCNLGISEGLVRLGLGWGWVGVLVGWGWGLEESFEGKSFSINLRKISLFETYFKLHLTQQNLRKLENILLKMFCSIPNTLLVKYKIYINHKVMVWNCPLVYHLFSSSQVYSLYHVSLSVYVSSLYVVLTTKNNIPIYKWNEQLNWAN